MDGAPQKPVLQVAADQDLSQKPVLQVAADQDLSQKPVLQVAADQDLSQKPVLQVAADQDLSQKPVLQVAADQDLSDVIVHSIRDHCGMKGCTIKEIQKLIHGTYAVEIADDLDLFRLIIVSCKKSIRHGRLFKHGCKYRVSFSELSLDPPSNGATVVAEKSGEKSTTLFVCELCKENGEGRQAASLSVNISKDGAQNEPVWTTMDSSKKCCLCQSQTSSLTTDEMSTTNSSMLNSSIASDTEVLSSSAVLSPTVPTRSSLSDKDPLLTASAAAAAAAAAAASGPSNGAGHVDFIQNSTSTSSNNKQNSDTSFETANFSLQSSAHNTDSPHCNDVVKLDKISRACSSSEVAENENEGGKARKTKNRRTQVKFLTDGLTPFYSSDGKRKRPALATGCSPGGPKKKLRMSLDGVASEDPGSIGGADGSSSLNGSGSTNLPRATVEVRRKKRWMYSSGNHGTYQLERSVKEDILFPHITEDDVKMFELARSRAQQRRQQQTRSMDPNSPSCQAEQADAIVVSCDKDKQQWSMVQSSENQGDACGPDRGVAEEEEVLMSRGNETIDVIPAGSEPQTDNPEPDIPCSGPPTNAVDSLADNDYDDSNNDDFADDVDDDDIDSSSVCENKHLTDSEVNVASSDRKGTEETFDSNINTFVETGDSTSDSNKGTDNTFGSTGDRALVHVTEGNHCTSDDIFNNANRMDCTDAITCGDVSSAVEDSNNHAAVVKSGVVAGEDVTCHHQTTTSDHKSGIMMMKDPESFCADVDTADNGQWCAGVRNGEIADNGQWCTGVRNGYGSFLQPLNATHSDSSFSMNSTEVNGNTVFADCSNSVVKDAGVVPAVQPDYVGLPALSRNAAIVSNESLEMSFNVEESPAVVDGHSEETCLQRQLVSSVVSNATGAVQPDIIQPRSSECGQNAATEKCTSGEDSAVIDTCDTLKEKAVGKTCGSDLTELTSFHAKVLCMSSCESLLRTAPPLQSNSTGISTFSVDLHAAESSLIFDVPLKLGQTDCDQTSTPSKDQHAKNASSHESLLLTSDILPKAGLNVSDTKSATAASLDSTENMASHESALLAADAHPKAALSVSDTKNGTSAALDADLAALPLKRNRKRKRFFCPDGCCSFDSDSQCATKKSDENPVKSKAGCPKGAKQKPSPQQPAAAAAVVVTPKVPRPRGRPRKYPLPVAQEEPPRQADTLPHVAEPSITPDVSITPTSADQTVNCCYTPESSGDTADKKSGDIPHGFDLDTIGVQQREDADAAVCLPCASVSDATVYRNPAEQDSSGGDDDVANAFDSEDESLSPTATAATAAAAATQELSASVSAALSGLLSIETVDLEVESIEENRKERDLVRADIFEMNVSPCLGMVPPVGVIVPNGLGNALKDGGAVTLPDCVDEGRVVECNVTSNELVQGVEAHEKESLDTVVGRHDTEIYVHPTHVYEKDIPSYKSVTSAFQPHMVIEGTTNGVLEKDVSSCCTQMLASEIVAAAANCILDNDVQTCGVESDTLQSAMAIEPPHPCVLDQNHAQACSMTTESFKPGVAVAQAFEKDVQSSCNIVTGRFESSELGLQEKDNQCGSNNVTNGFELEMSDAVTRKVVGNDLQSFRAAPKQSETEFVDASVYHYIHSAPQAVTNNEQSCGIAVSNCLAAEMIDRNQSAGTERASIAEKNLFQYAMTQECHAQNTDVLLGSSIGGSNCRHRQDGRALDGGLPSGDCHLQTATSNLLHHDCYMPLSTDCRIQVPVEFQVDSADSQIQLTVLPSDNRVHVLSESTSEALMRLVNPTLSDCHLQLNSLTSDVCSIADHHHQFTHTPVANAIFSSCNSGYVQTCTAAVPHQTTQCDSSATFLNTSSCGVTATIQMPTSASNSVGGSVQDGTWPVQPSNLLYALPLQTPSPLANFGLNFPSNVMYALPIQSMLTGMNFERSDPPPPEAVPTSACNKPESTAGNQSSGPCPVHAQNARGLMPQLLGCQPYIIICPGSLPISSILQPLSESLGQILPYICSPTDPRHLSCHSSVLGNFMSPLQQYSWGLQTQNTSAPSANVGQFAKVSTERNPAVDLFASLPNHTHQLVDNEQQNTVLGTCNIAHENQAFTSVNASQLIADSLLASQFMTAQNIPVSLGIRNNQAEFGSVPIQVHSSGFIFPPGK